MKKVLLSGALALAVVGSWAFYPKAAEPGGYMMVVGRLYGSDMTLTTVAPDGQYTEVGVPSTKSLNEDLHKAELLKLNELRRSGWRVVSSSAMPTSGVTLGSYETTYLLEKP